MSEQDQLQLPPVILGTSGLGNLYIALPYEVKLDIVRQFVLHSAKPAVLDSAGKYGAGLALESIGQCLKDLNVNPDDIIISNKLGWLRTPLTTPEPTFEPGVWVDLEYDAVQNISYKGILECYNQGNELLGNYEAQFVSVHDPDEYLSAATNGEDKTKRYQDILDAYRALLELKAEGKVKSVGVGAKDWHSIKQITNDVKLDWVMIANSMTVHSHPEDLLVFMQELEQKGVLIINSAVFNGGFLTGGDYYNYHLIDKESTEGTALYNWRDRFYELCKKHSIEPAAACVQFGLAAPGVKSVALSTSSAKRVESNLQLSKTSVPAEFWDIMHGEGLITDEGLSLVK
ncbi:aldo/keto reductase [Mucilaginibacter terrae]|uniref:D-threo-aldose 1-dehydrogenase n=1 Tax=Mucilaginibacter terrae TaxID=1955052 RepID=A0ABU3GNW0_9SPHI|nr:aldo/keto reductase [Mucilaginibacter terrae]MDT3401475.1 D-threo-aldose 1-dehydrogenase [Mucilaginibacter terrae]